MRDAGFLTVIWLCASLCALPGCVRNEAEMEKEVLAHDASFKEAIDKRNSLRSEIDARQEACRQKEAEIDEKIESLKAQKVQDRKEYARQAAQIKRQLDPDKRDLERELIEFARQYKRKKEELNNIERDMDEINDLITKKDDLALSQEEILTWNERLAALTKKKTLAVQEKDKLQKEIRITKLKVKVLKL